MAGSTSRSYLDDRLIEAVFEQSLDGVMITVPDGRILAANPAACAILRSSEEEICRRGRKGFSQESDPSWAPALEERRRTGRVQAIVPMLRANGAPFFAEVSSTVFVDKTGATRTCVIFRDVTERVRLEHELRAATEITQALLGGDDTEHVLTVIARAARGLADASEAGVVTAGDYPGSVVVAAGDGLRMPELVGRWYPPGSLLARIMASRTSAIFDDLTAVATQEDGRNLRLGPAMIVPIVGGDKVFGNLLVGSGPGHRKYERDELATIEKVAQSAGVALTLAEARAKGERAALLEEQTRIAADLHDSVLQQLFAAGLRLQGVSRLAPAVVADRIDESVARLDEVIAEIRQTIFGLHRRVPGVGLTDAVRELADEYAAHLGFTPGLRIAGRIERCDEPTSGHLVSVLRESLSNVLRHAHAGRVDITVSETTGEIALRVEDDGRGLPFARSGGNGLNNMARRAEALGGRFELTPMSPHGTRVEWRAPSRAPAQASTGGLAGTTPSAGSPDDGSPDEAVLAGSG